MNAKPITVLAGDIGGTKTNLALYTTDEGGTQVTAAAGKNLGERLRNGHDRKAVTEKMQQTLMEKFSEST